MDRGKEIAEQVRRLDKPFSMEWGVAQLTLPGQTESGDLYVVKPYDEGVLIAVIDGLGHGEEAAIASRAAISTLEEHAGESLTSLVQRCHEKLQRTRGVVMAIALMSRHDETLTWMSVGNVEGTLYRIDSHFRRENEHILMRSGVVGHNLPSLQVSVLPLYRGDGLIFTTDGIKEGYVVEQHFHDPLAQGTDESVRSRIFSGRVFRDSPQELADKICAGYAKRTDDALVLTVRYEGVAK